jgi:thioredoxin reductase (NADPH)
VVGGGNSAGQAVVFLAQSTKHVYMVVRGMTGANPNTDWLDGCVALDRKGFIKTGPDLTAEELQDSHWSLARRPYLLETTVPGVFAVGDVRGGNVKRAASV